MEQVLKIVFLAAIGTFTVTAAIWDAKKARLPNWLTVPSFAAGILFHVIYGYVSGNGVLSHLGHSLLGALVGLAPMLLLWMIGGGGAGDAKLMAAIGAWLGPWLTFLTYVLGTVIGIVGSGLMMIFKTGTQGFTKVKRDYIELRSDDGKKNKSKHAAGKQRTRTRKQHVRLGIAFLISTWVILGFLFWQNTLWDRLHLQKPAAETATS